MVRLLLFSFGLGIAMAAVAQEIPEAPVLPKFDNIQLQQPEAITFLMEDHRQFMHQLGAIPGYRIQLGTFTRLDAANRFRMQLEEKFPEYPVYILFNEPTYRVRVGDLTNRIEGRHLLEVIIQEYPGAILVKDEIKLTAE